MKFKTFGKDVTISEDADFVMPEKISIGSYVTIEAGCFIDATYGLHISIGDHVTIKRGSVLVASGHGFPDGFIDIKQRVHVGFYNVLNGHAGLTIGEDTLLGPMVHLNGYRHHYENKDKLVKEQGGTAKKIVIGNDVYICSGSTILGCHINDGAVIAAQSLVREDVGPFIVVGGVPAVKIKERL